MSRQFDKASMALASSDVAGRAPYRPQISAATLTSSALLFAHLRVAGRRGQGVWDVHPWGSGRNSDCA